MTDFVLEALDVYKDYQQGESTLSVLRNLNLNVSRGEIVAIVGRSGSGKSTLLNVLSGLDELNQGQVTLAKLSWSKINSSTKDRVRNEELGFVYQFHHLLPEFTALENVMMPARIGGIKYRVAKIKALDLLSSVGLAERGSHFPNELSGGERQRVAIARALVNAPSLVLMDEPTGNLDESSRESVLDLIKHLSKTDGYSFVVVTHDRYVADIADRILTLENGQLSE